jgi:predicted dehydrogenase
VPIESQGVAYWKWQNGVHGHMMTGFDAPKDAQIRLVGTDGAIEIGVPDGPQLRYRNSEKADWQTEETGDTIHGDQANHEGVMDLVAALREGREPELAGRRALRATELIFATYESARRRGRIDLPLTIDDAPLLTLIEAVGE